MKKVIAISLILVSCSQSKHGNTEEVDHSGYYERIQDSIEMHWEIINSEILTIDPNIPSDQINFLNDFRLLTEEDFQSKYELNNEETIDAVNSFKLTLDIAMSIKDLDKATESSKALLDSLERIDTNLVNFDNLLSPIEFYYRPDSSMYTINEDGDTMEVKIASY